MCSRSPPYRVSTAPTIHIVNSAELSRPQHSTRRGVAENGSICGQAGLGVAPAQHTSPDLQRPCKRLVIYHTCAILSKSPGRDYLPKASPPRTLSSASHILSLSSGVRPPCCDHYIQLQLSPSTTLKSTRTRCATQIHLCPQRTPSTLNTPYRESTTRN